MFIRSLTIERFRGLERLEWRPGARLNCLIGPGDVGKSTILSAIERLLDPATPITASEFDYKDRKVELGFQISAVLGDLDEDFTSSLRTPPLQGWLGGQLRPLPDEHGAEPVLVAKVSGSSDLDVSHVLVTPGDAEDVAFSPGMRRRLLLSRIASGGRAVGELRLRRGSLLERHLRTADFQGQIRSAASAALAGLELPDQADEAVERLREQFREAGLPGDLALGLITPQGWSLLGLLGLVAGEDPSESIPLAFAGAGTRQLVMFRLAAGLMDAAPIVLMDEPELGLEPYRQRNLVSEIRSAVGTRGQAFLSSHSPATLEALEVGEISHLSEGGNPISLIGKGVSRVQREAPDALLSRLPTLCEGQTEAGFLSVVLDWFAKQEGRGTCDALGIRFVARRGQPLVLDEADDLLAAGLSIGCFVDNELQFSGRRRALAANSRCAYGSWEGVRNLEEAVASWLPWAKLGMIVKLAADLRERPEKELLQQLGDAIGSPGAATLDQIRHSHAEEKVREALAAAMNSKANPWFKTVERGRALGSWFIENGLPDAMRAVLEDFWARALEVAGWARKQ